MTFIMTVYHTWAETLCEGVDEDSGAWCMVSGESHLISWNDM